MSAVWKLEKDLCRCCHSEGSFHNLLQPRIAQGQEEYYLEMLRQSFDIELEPVPGVINEITFKICETCIIRLRDAANFKRQVLLCEKRFKDVYKDILKALTPSDNSTSIIKVEVPSLQETPSTFQDSIKVEVDRMDCDDDDDNFQLHFDDDDNEPLFNAKTEGAKTSPKAKKVSTTAKKKKKPPKTITRQVRKNAPVDEASAAENQAEGEEGGEQTKKGEAKIAKLKFFLRETDYKREGEDYICTHCDKKIGRRDTLTKHVKAKHYNSAQKLVCTYCKEKFNTHARLNAHKLEEHNINDKFKCKACGREFNRRLELSYHINVHHMLGEKIRCEHCKYETFSEKNMKRHEINHRTDKEFSCRFCVKSFHRSDTLMMHERIHTGDKRQVCNVCGKAFVQKPSLDHHMSKYHPEVTVPGSDSKAWP